MTKRKFKFTAEKVFTIFLPLTAFIGAIVLVLSFVFFPALFFSTEELKANITDGKFKAGEEIAFYNNKQIKSLSHPLLESRFLKDERVLAATNEELEERWIEIDLTEQMLYAHEGDEIVYQFPISSGKWGRTPRGDFRIWAKLKYTLMHGGSRDKNTYYYLPNVPYTQYFHHGYGLHGTYWHNNFGHPMSHGCINMYTPDAETLFYWTSPVVPADKWVIYPTKNSPGTRVLIHGNAPYE